MVIKDIKKEIDNNYDDEYLKNFSSFVLAKCAFKDDSVSELVATLPLKNAHPSFIIEPDFILTDRNGRVLLKGEKGIGRKEDDIYSVDGNRALVVTKKEKLRKVGVYYVLDSIVLYEYDGEKLVPID